MILHYKKYVLFAFWGFLILFNVIPSFVQAHQLELHSAVQRKTLLTSDRVTLHYLIGGQGPKTLFFIPGWLMPAEVFNAQLNYFSQHYRVIAFSPRSQGQSDIYVGAQLAELRARDIKELLAATQTQDFTLIGWSLGVMEALDYVHRYGTQGLQSLVLIDNSIGEGAPPRAGASQKNKAMTSESFKKYAKSFVGSLFKSSPPTDFIQTIEHSALRLEATPTNAFAILRKPYAREYYKDTIYNTQVPIWYAITPRFSEQAALLSAKHRLSEFKIYSDNAGHALFVDKADEFNQDLATFLRKSP